MTRVFVCLVGGWLACAALAPFAQATPPIKNAFEEKYIKPSESEELKAIFKKEGCNVCHVKGEKEKSVQNTYGKELNKLIEGSANERMKAAREAGTVEQETEKLMKEVAEAFKKLETMKAPTGDTFGERIKAGKLPVDIEEKK